MKKHFKSEPKLYRKLCDSFSDTEVEFRKGSCEYLVEEFQQKCAIGDGKEQFLPQTSKQSKAFGPLKIKDEVKIDLGKFDSSSTSSARSAPKIYPISEEVSRASSNMLMEQHKRILEVQRITEANKNKTRPKSRTQTTPNIRSLLCVKSDVEVLKPFSPLNKFQPESEFAEEFEETPERKEFSSYQDRLNQFNSPYGSLASFKRAQIQRLSADSADYRDSCQTLLTIRSYSTTSSAQESCFGCIFKPLAQACRKKPKKNKL